jgi:hypothetical protein
MKHMKAFWLGSPVRTRVERFIVFDGDSVNEDQVTGSGANYVDAEMIRAFITLTEYRQRFAQ